MRSLERHLLAWILGALTLGAIFMVLVTYLVTREEMNEVFDAELKSMAQGVANYHRFKPETKEGRSLPAVRTDTPEDSEIVTVAWTRTGQQLYSSDPRAKVPFSETAGLSRPHVGEEDWIVYTAIQADGVAQAAQRVGARREMAGESAAKSFPPLILVVLITAALLVYALRQGLRPLDGAARDIALRSAASLEPICSDEVPGEVAPLVAAINGLMRRISVALSKQRNFLADAAHELRTPVTALRLQLQLLERADGDTARMEAMKELDAGIARAQRIVEQLLELARSEPDGETTSMKSVELGDIVREIVGELSVLADQRGIDLGASVARGVCVDGNAEQLKSLLNNLVENALRYTPAGGQVDVEAFLCGEAPALRVVDTGPGIPEVERARVFERFYRGPTAQNGPGDARGSGLGLSIVRSIADRHRAVVSVMPAPSGQGTEMRLVFPTYPVARP